MNYNNLRAANMARSAIWGKDKIDMTWRIAELGGEVGELCNKIGRASCRERV